MKRLALCLVLIAGCGGADATSTTGEPVTTTTETTTTTTTIAATTTTALATTTTLSQSEVDAQNLAADVLVIKQLYRRYSDSWFGGENAGFDYLAAHNHPAEECTAAEFADSWQVAEGYREEAIVDEGSIERDDGWSIPGGRANGIVPDGRIYIFKVSFTYTAPGFDIGQEDAEVHTVIEDDGDAYFFFGCREE
jgi:hypothetical protein